MLAAITFIIVAVLGRSPANLLFFTRAFKEALLVQFFPHGILFPSFSPILLSREGQPLKHSSGAISMNSLLSPPARYYYTVFQSHCDFQSDCENTLFMVAISSLLKHMNIYMYIYLPL